MSFTSNDLARICGVSRTTIYRALNDTGRINEETKKKILKVAKENNYSPDLLARSLAKGRSNTISVIVMNVTNRHFSQLLNSVEQEAEKNGFGVNITLHGQDPEMEQKQVQRMIDYHVDGIILSSVNTSKEYVDFLKKSPVPIVTVDNLLSKEIPFVGIDNKEAVKKMTNRAIKQGYKRIVLVAPKKVETGLGYVHEERVKGFYEIMQEQRQIEYETIDLQEEKEKAMELCLPNKGTAFICTGDIFALELMKFMREKNLKAGLDYGLAGFDNIDTLDYIVPRIDTIDALTHDVAVVAIRMLMSLVNQEKVKKNSILKTKYIKGQTL